jgi:O-methyltransferase
MRTIGRGRRVGADRHRSFPYAIDEISAERVAGWAYADGEAVSVEVLVDELVVGTTAPHDYRIDVALALDRPEVASAGFELRLTPAQFAHVDQPTADVAVRLHAGGHTVTAASAVVPVLASGSPPDLPLAPLPPAIVQLLRRLRPSVYQGRWDEEAYERVAGDIGLLLHGGPHSPALHTHLSLLGQLWIRAATVERYFPRENTSAAPDAKDRSAIQNSAVEVFSIAAHFASIVAHDVPGPLAEFGCFKGFSTAVLSDACHQLGRPLMVFDSFAGLPPSDSDYYTAGEFAGSRAEVEANVTAYGRPAPVTYHEGFFADTIPQVSMPQLAQVWMDVDLETSAKDVVAVFPRLDPRAAVFSHECPKDAFTPDGIVGEPGPDAVIPPILDGFTAADRTVTGRHVDGHTGAFWDAEAGIPVLPTTSLLALRDLALDL